MSARDLKDENEESSQQVQMEDKGKDKEVSAPEVEEPDETEFDTKRHLNVVFIGHVDSGKSTIGGQILFLSGQVDDRTIQKYEKEAKDKSRESWYMAYIMDTNEEERVKGITVEVGRAHFETETTRFTILDAPGHKSYVPNMISGASQADIGVLVISARKGEFETGYEKGGQTREHVQLAKTLGVSKLLVVVNKMDEPTVNWSKERYDEIESKMVPFLRSSGYNVKKDVQFLPISGLLGSNMKTRVVKSVCPWWNGPCLLEALDAIEGPLRDPKGPFRMPIIDRFKDMGTVVMGKVESGSVSEGDSLVVMPNKVQVKVVAVYRDKDKVRHAGPGENLRVRLAGIEEEDIISGFVLSSIAKPVTAVTEFVAQLQILELLENAIFTAGYKAVLHIHSVVEECEIVELLQQIDPKTKKRMKKKVLFVKTNAVVFCRVQVNNMICLEKFSDFPQLGRFTLRTEGLEPILVWQGIKGSSLPLTIIDPRVVHYPGGHGRWVLEMGLFGEHPAFRCESKCHYIRCHQEYLIILAVVSGVIFFTTLTVVLWLLLYKWSNKQRHFHKLSNYAASALVSPSWRVFTKEELKSITKNFSEGNRLLGDAKTGGTYSGLLPDGSKVAVKRLNRSTFQRKKEFYYVIGRVARLHHPNLVSIKGCCYDHGVRYIVYEFIANGPLDRWLYHVPRGGRSLDWAMRMKIATTLAQGIAFLHDKVKPHVVHRDIHAINVLLDEDFKAHLMGVGLSKFVPWEAMQEWTIMAGGTYGYLAPEFVYRNEITTKSDVYSFGVLLLEIVSGRRPAQASSGSGLCGLPEHIRMGNSLGTSP
ncbi:hypothetical protein SAY86_000859 [Trapa natans]|uniref:Uncharacterized protein n=1 Tax=Trapa natans TaxID=22666 RepID=A0AAN7MZS5_TRANT|nr:hypothetical protein SAY86_000859 [Trapa natans]